MSVDIPDGATEDSILARVGVKIAGVEDMIFSPVKKRNFQ